MAYCLVYMTAETPEEAKGLGRALVEARLAACANVIPGMVPIFWWDGKVQEGSEAVLIAKTRRELVEELNAFVTAHHGYDCPCVVALPIEAGNPAFLQWIGAETRGAEDARLQDKAPPGKDGKRREPS